MDPYTIIVISILALCCFSCCFVVLLLCLLCYTKFKEPEEFVEYARDETASKNVVTIEKCPVLGRKVVLHKKYRSCPNAKANILFMHGLGNHMGMYDELGDKFNKAGYNFYIYDLRGHGQSDGARFTVTSMEEYSNDFKYILQNAKEIDNGLDIYVVAHSLSAAVCLYMDIKEPLGNINGRVKGQVISGVGYKDDIVAIVLIAFFAKFFPSLTVAKSFYLDPKQLTRNKAYQEMIRKDGLIMRSWIKSKLGYEMLKLVSFVGKNLGKIKTPLFLHHGKSDIISPSRLIKFVWEGIGNIDKEMKMYDNLKHEILHACYKEKEDYVFDNMVNWINERISK